MALASPGESVDVVGNLPYYITSQILLQLFAAGSRARSPRAGRGHDAARSGRTGSKHAPGGREYGLLSATAQINARVRDVVHCFPPAAFSPPPDVYSTVLRLEFAPRFAELGVDTVAGFDGFLKACFAQKRKTLTNNLRAAGYAPDVLRMVWPAEIPPQARAGIPCTGADRHTSTARSNPSASVRSIALLRSRRAWVRSRAGGLEARRSCGRWRSCGWRRSGGE